MLVQFRVKNFASFREEQLFSLVAEGGLREKDEALTQNQISAPGKLDLLKAAVVYGANASGKSNLLRAINCLVTALSSPPPGQAVGDYAPFLLDRRAGSEPTLLEAVFLIQGAQYRYGFELSQQQVVAEWLYGWKKQETLIFERRGTSLRVGRAFPKLKELQGKDMINAAALLLNLGALFNDQTCRQIKAWANQVSYYTPLQDMEIALANVLGTEHSVGTIAYLLDPAGKERVLQLLQVADVGIDDLEVIDEKSLRANLLLGKQQPPVTKSVVHTIRRAWDEATQKFELVSMPLATFESEGTQKLFTLIGLILAILDKGGLLVADELDTKLHPLLTQRIVQLFHSPVTNPRGAQFIFATHDTNLLSAGLFRRDQIWFTEKDPRGATQLYALTDYKPGGNTVRNDEQLAKNYIAGKYGGIPYLSSFDALFEVGQPGALTHE